LSSRCCRRSSSASSKPNRRQSVGSEAREAHTNKEGGGGKEFKPTRVQSRRQLSAIMRLMGTTLAPQRSPCQYCGSSSPRGFDAVWVRIQVRLRSFSSRERNRIINDLRSKLESSLRTNPPLINKGTSKNVQRLPIKRMTG
jgi:hypothetical protein